ncbi:hypothetical protein CLPUN_00030 [Clostridium puniceum]|uniref:Uncharacterized protein n=1 Tax=Clostridium puniceum TaxID=29367 RepID=A0A1S8TY52_9CLOT|nr:hypothetical protein [Clostridium puniceum]OOM82617.1 hypothetical protein CLPUN_00030 [Clostridium puniceum]
MKLDAANVTFTSSITAFNQLGKNKVNLALDYLFQLANNGKQYWVDVIGWPLVITDTFATLKSKTQIIKNTIATNIVSKGVAANNTDSLSSLADAISRITIEGMGGTRIKTGIAPVSLSTYKINIENDIDFIPRIVFGYVLYADNTPGSFFVAVAPKIIGNSAGLNRGSAPDGYTYSIPWDTAVDNIKVSPDPAGSKQDNQYPTAYWIAVE